jgi:signal transduction histidine kinase
MFIEAISDNVFPYLNFSGMHIITIVSGGMIATSVAYLSLKKLDALYEKIYHENEERKRAEAELEKSRAEAEIYLDLMGHDINNMNQVATSYTEMAIQKLDSGEALNTGDRYMLLKTMDMLNTSSMLIENVGKIRRIKSGELNVEEIDLSKMIAELRSTYFQAPGKNVDINYTVDDDCVVRANGLVRDVFYNLIGNAVKHSDEPNVKVDVEVKRIDMDGAPYCRISVADNGQGISDEVKAKIFKRFERGNTRAIGKGLGLYLVKTLTEQFKGKAWVEDRVPGDRHRGSRFVVLLPAAAP